MPEAPGKAVFISYASQDVEAAKRICEALRSGGVEVWFDVEGGLEHGDEWDAKIRRHIKECLLFIPVISAATQARHEGYFRIEWNLAVDRAMGIASGVPFILPAVIDDTGERYALVPEYFRRVQWTRLPGGAVSAEVRARYLKLWSQRAGVLSREAATQAPGSERVPPGQSGQATQPPLRRERSLQRTHAVAAGALAVCAAAAAAWWFSGSRKPPPESAAPPKPSPAAQAPGTAQIVARAWEQLGKLDAGRAELEVADGLCKSAADINPSDPDTWAAWSQVDTMYVGDGRENTPQRREGARTKAARALQLSPGSYEARLAQAYYLVRAGAEPGVAIDAPAADDLLRALLRERPAEPRALLAQGALMRSVGKRSEARAVFGQLAQAPAHAPLAWSEAGWTALADSDYAGAAAAADRSIALRPYWRNLILRALVAIRWEGDLNGAKGYLDRVPAPELREAFGAAAACELYYLRREPVHLLNTADGATADWLHAGFFDGPKAQWAGLAHHEAGRSKMAQAQWQAALKLVEGRLADQPDSAFLLKWRGELLAETGNKAEARRALQQSRDAGGSTGAARSPIWDAQIQVAMGHPENAMNLLEQRAGDPGLGLTAAMCRLDPGLDPLRENPRFKALLARLEADPRASPAAKAKPASEPAPSP